MLRNTSQLHSPRRGSANRAALALLASAIVLVVLTLTLSRHSGPPEELTISCAAGLREPMEAICAAYEKEHGVRLTIHYGGSSTLLANLRLNHDADLFLPADDSYIELAKTDGLVTETYPIAQMRPVLVMKKQAIEERKALSERIDLRISMTDPAAAATGKLVKEALERAGKWGDFKKRVTVFKASVSEVAADLQVGAVDAGIIWDAMLKQLPDFVELPFPELDGVTARVVAGVVAESEHPDAARELASFLAKPDQGQRFFIDAGFSPPVAAGAAR